MSKGRDGTFPKPQDTDGRKKCLPPRKKAVSPAERTVRMLARSEAACRLAQSRDGPTFPSLLLSHAGRGIQAVILILIRIEYIREP